MSNACRWNPCVTHRGLDAQRFIATYFAQVDRQVLFIVGAGFDPRSSGICSQVASACGPRAKGFFVREERPGPSIHLVQRAEANVRLMSDIMPGNQVCTVQIFAPDGAVIGGREVARLLQQLPLMEFTDIVVDVSSLSVGISYPITLYLARRAEDDLQHVNLHVMVTSSPGTDASIVPVASDKAGFVTGFQGGFGLDANARAVKLWLPHLIQGKKAILERIFLFVKPDDICPILPFPASNPRLADDLIQYYGPEFESVWDVDARNLLYADETNPIDLYRTILRIDEARRRVFAQVGGAMTVLSPVGSKALAIGAMMAAIERGFPVVYVEAAAYDVDFAKLDASGGAPGEITHIWLYGDAYPHARATQA